MLYPHEVRDWDIPVPAIRRAENIAPFEAAMMYALVRARFLGEPHRSLALGDYRRHSFVFYNGGAPYYYGKHQFLEVLRSLGYDAPASVLVRPGEARRHLDAIQGLSDEQPRFIKPFLGSKSWGLHVADSSDDVMQFLARQHVPYLVQEYVPPKEEWRYILHRTWADLKEKRPPSIRMAYEKIGPPVWGAGMMRMQRLSKKALWRDPVTGDALHYRRLPDPTRLTEIDALMLELLAAYEHLTGAPLATLCVDLGFTQRGPVIYESQLPFGDPYNWLGKPGQYTKARRAFSDSLTWSGVVARGLA
jgi:hypothetical protein